jgi:hypothetical protein
MIRRILVCVLLVLPVSLSAQAPGQPRWGLGLGLDANTIHGARAVDIRLPLRMGNRGRIEPAFGFASSSENDRIFSGGSTYDQEIKFSYYSAGILIARLFVIDDRVRGYIGPRLTLQRFSRSFGIKNALFAADTSASTRSVDKLVGLVTGAEVRVTNHLSVGGEVDLTYSFFGKSKLDPDPPPTSLNVIGVRGGHDLETGGAVVVRWFLGGSKASE